MGAREHAIERLVQALQLAAGIGLLQKVDVFFGKIQCGFDQHAQPHQRIAQRVDLLRERTRQRAARAARRGFGAGIDQIGNRFGLGQVDLVVEKRAFGELAGLGQAQARQQGLARAIGLRRGFEAAREQQLQHHRAAMRLQFKHVFTGITVRAGEEQRQAMVNRLALGIAQRQIGGFAGFQFAPAQPLHQRRQALAGYPHYAHGASTGGCGNGGNGLVVAGEHGESLGWKSSGLAGNDSREALQGSETCG